MDLESKIDKSESKEKESISPTLKRILYATAIVFGLSFLIAGCNPGYYGYSGWGYSPYRGHHIERVHERSSRYSHFGNNLNFNHSRR